MMTKLNVFKQDRLSGSVVVKLSDNCFVHWQLKNQPIYFMSKTQKWQVAHQMRKSSKVQSYVWHRRPPQWHQRGNNFIKTPGGRALLLCSGLKMWREKKRSGWSWNGLKWTTRRWSLELWNESVFVDRKNDGAPMCRLIDKGRSYSWYPLREAIKLAQ